MLSVTEKKLNLIATFVLTVTAFATIIYAPSTVSNMDKFALTHVQKSHFTHEQPKWDGIKLAQNSMPDSPNEGHFSHN